MKINFIQPNLYPQQTYNTYKYATINFRGTQEPENLLEDKDITRLDSKIVLGRAPGNCDYDNLHRYKVDDSTLIDDLLYLKENHNVDTIVDLRATHIEGANYKKKSQKAHALGLKYLNLEMDGAVAPTSEQLDKFFSAVNDSKGSVYIHCHAGRDRTGMLAACYLAKTQKLEPEQTFQRVFDERGVKRLKYMWGHPEEHQKLLNTLQKLAK